MDSSRQPTSSLNTELRSLIDLAKECGGCKVFGSVQDLLESEVGASVDGVIICTPHATHYEIAEAIIQRGMIRALQEVVQSRPVHILLEKPMTTNVEEAKKLSDLVHSYWRTCSITDDAIVPFFQLNHTANFREQTRVARDLIKNGAIGSIRHINASMASPLSWLFGHPRNLGWNEPTEGMLGNGFAWGQSSHLLAWIFQVTDDNINPQQVYCAMNHSESSGADLSHSATIRCANDIVMSLSGTCMLPGNEHGEPKVGKEIIVQIYGSEGSLFYCGNDNDPSSGRLELRVGKTKNQDEEEGTVKVYCEKLGFHFENTDQEGNGPESLQNFIAACLGKKNYQTGADDKVGLKSVQLLDAMYRSQHSGTSEEVAYCVKSKRKTKRGST